MKRKTSFVLSIVVIMLLALTIQLSIAIDRVAVDDVRAMIGRELAVGATSEQIEKFFATHGISNSYDRLGQRYHGIIRDVSRKPFVNKAIEIDVYTDVEKRFNRAVVGTSYTFL